ncbi:hypothetical protein ZIOFF_048935 [Zingiber officinale]|uniref:Threonylcarbamoyl-AMP synthase n=1 Tax=Zingiber officinale TaxID=94328 RepID=A0A8J5G8F9_ZINOF|nr:hypothetical protein ZIOFF_048935 [Zingiber officinale]
MNGRIVCFPRLWELSCEMNSYPNSQYLDFSDTDESYEFFREDARKIASFPLPGRQADHSQFLINMRGKKQCAEISSFGLVSQKKSSLAGAIWSRMSQSLDSVQCSEGKAGVALPATDAHVEEAIEAIKAEEVIAVPTDTLYGFACDACSSEAVNRIYEIKGRKQTSPLAISVGDVSDISRFAIVDHLPHDLLYSLLPGPVTLVLKRGATPNFGDSSILEKSLNPGLDSIGVRVPDFEFIRSIARGSGSALALTSANLSGQPSSVSIKDFENLWQHCAYVYDGGVLPSGRAGSTVVDLTNPGSFKILRPGSARPETTAILEKFGLEEVP